ncbi:DUF7487 domain-containing protein [Trichloromonas sp.]|uniref:DUF7487 domain-containing protein n=1 Tax=Trichloromonas sp. TaxID=3069249 RepID=UPI002A48F4DC|nr:hypothetical protein [Trichloromonas sp.]
MIITDKVNVKIINHNLEYYRYLGYDVKHGDIINVNAEFLSKGSHIRIDVKCEKCGIINSIKYQDYVKITKDKTIKYYCQLCVKTERTEKTNIKKYGVKNVSQSNIIKNKKIKTNLKNWGTENVFQNENIKDKIKKTCKNKYGSEHPNKSNIIKNKSLLTRIKKGKQINPEYYKPYVLYRKNVLSITRIYKKYLFDKWDGNDFYDNEYIKKNLNLHPNDKNYPTIDHKISVYNGFINNIDYKIIGNIDNLCITKRRINSSKQNENCENYKNKLKYND